MKVQEAQSGRHWQPLTPHPLLMLGVGSCNATDMRRKYFLLLLPSKNSVPGAVSLTLKRPGENESSPSS